MTQAADNDNKIIKEAIKAIPTSAEARQAVNLLLQYQEHQQAATSDDIRHLLLLSRQIEASIASQLAQSTLDQWLM